ncbi:MAG TPA: PepSY-like domain-containing protein [Chitinophagaceae bacterium]|nr:PepSY-like domain-containing protein [Chitinophagaceae bacterium]
MRNNFLVLALGLSASISAGCQSTKVPEAVLTSFAARFPTTTNVKWSKEDKTEFEAEFKLSSRAVSANFKANGDWVVTETTIPVTDLPAAVASAVDTKYPGSVFSVIEKVEEPGNKVYYEATIKWNGKKREIKVSAAGGFIN